MRLRRLGRGLAGGEAAPATGPAPAAGPSTATTPAPATVVRGPRPRPLDGPSLDGSPARPRAARLQLLALPGFLGLAVLLLGTTWTSPATRTLGAGLGDPGMFAWFLRWTPFAAGRRISPLFSDYLNHPDGINLMWNTWVPLPGMVLSPLTLAFGPVLTLNVLLTLGYGLSAWSAYVAIRRYVPNHGAAAAGGLVYGFSPAMAGHSHHPNLILAFLLPWLLVLVDEVVVRQRRSPVWLGATLGVAAAAQLLIGEERFAGAVLVGVVLLVVLAAMHPRSVPGRVRYAAMAFAVSVVVFEALVGLPLRAQFGGPARVHADITQEARGASDLLAVVMPDRLSVLASNAAIRFGDRFAGTKEAYLGVPLLLVVALALRRRRNPVVRVGFAMLLACLVLSLGARLRVAGHPTPVPLPWTVVEPLPLLRNMVPSRLALFTALFAGLLLAVAIEGLWRDGGRWRRALAVAAAVLALAFLAPTAPLQPRPVAATPPFFTTSAVRSLPRDGVALVVPFPRQGRANQAMLWQAEAGMWFKMPGGYFIGPDPRGGARHDAPATTTARILYRIGRGGRPPVLRRALREEIGGDFARWGIGSVVLGPMPHREVMSGFLTDLLGQRPERIGGVELWRGATVAPTGRRR